ncbi:MAG TPA: hypothetical protein VFV72_14060 [Candidatus Limnocylindrales bacterium]|nr:hypothetical protein [Candidatus Limnocylindrales bacterium]
MLARLVVAGLLLAHAAIHVSFLVPSPPATADGPAWPFAIDHSALLGRLGVDAGLARLLALALVAVTLGAFGTAALVVLGIAPFWLWSPAIVSGAAASLVLLVTFFHPWLVLGVAIDVALIWASLVLDWTPGSASPEV